MDDLEADLLALAEAPEPKKKKKDKKKRKREYVARPSSSYTLSVR